MERRDRNHVGGRQRMDGKAASVDKSFESLGSEERPRNGAVAGGSLGSRGPFRRWEILEHICL